MNFTFRPPWWAAGLLCIGLFIFIKLGLWQCARSSEKKQMLKVSKQESSKITLLSKELKVKLHQQLIVNGPFDNKHTFLLDNQFYQHKVGFDILVPLKTSTDRYLLVDRGWIQAMPARKEMPIFSNITNDHDLKGKAYFPSSKTWVLNSKLDNAGNWPLIIEKVDFKQLELLLNIKLYPFILRLDATNSGALDRDWRVVTMSPAKHIGYAIQWFGMALAAIIIFLVLNIERRSNGSK